MQKGVDPTVNQDQVYESLKASKFKQQKLPAWRPVPTITSTTITFVSFGVVFLAIGVVVLVYSNKIVDQSIKYNDKCTEIGVSCEVSFEIAKTMEKPVMVYYQINNFYQNHRRYVKSKSDSQLNGKDITLKEMEASGDCSPVETNLQMGKITAVDGTTPLSGSSLAIPCGLIAKSLFNDDYTLNKDGNVIVIDQKDIAWQADRDLKYKNLVKEGQPADYWKTVQWIDMTNEHFIVWMRPAGLPNFRKLWGRIQQNLEPGKYSFTIQNNFDVSHYSGEKFIVLSTVNAFGGNNSFLGISYIVVGSVCILLAVVFLIGYQIHQKKKNN